MELPRQDPDQLLRAIRNDASTKKSGKLKIFFGYAAGVGKTYAMLQAAHQANQGNKAIGKPNCYQKVIICSIGVTLPYLCLLRRNFCAAGGVLLWLQRCDF